MLNRRDFLAGSAALTIAPVVSLAANSILTDPAAAVSGRTVINAITGYANLAKGFGFTTDPTNSDANGYPIKTLAGRGQAAAVGIWNCIRIDGSTFDLVSNVTTGLPSVWDHSDPYIGPGGEAISQASNVAVYFLNQGKFSGFTNLIFCKLAN